MSKKKAFTQPATRQSLEMSAETILNTDSKYIRQDLLKTLVITVLLLIGIFGIFIYLG